MIFPASRAFRLRVTRITRVSAHFARFTFVGPESEHLLLRGPDQRVKLLLPFDGGRVTDFGLFEHPRPSITEWYRRWRDLPDEDRNPLRTYTLRAARPKTGEVDIEFVLHGTDGPASAWAHDAAVGDEVTVIGPDRRSEEPGRGGAEWRPGHARRVLLVGDETAAPAICAIVESLPPGTVGSAFIETPEREDRLDVVTSSGVEVTWLPRDGAPVGSRLRESVRGWGDARASAPGVIVDDPDVDAVLWEVPESATGDEYAWLAGEASVITDLRRYLVSDLGIARTDVAFMGYWRQGRPEGV